MGVWKKEIGSRGEAGNHAPPPLFSHLRSPRPFPRWLVPYCGSRTRGRCVVRLRTMGPPSHGTDKTSPSPLPLTINLPPSFPRTKSHHSPLPPPNPIHSFKPLPQEKKKKDLSKPCLCLCFFFGREKKNNPPPKVGPGPEGGRPNPTALNMAVAEMCIPSAASVPDPGVTRGNRG